MHRKFNEKESLIISAEVDKLLKQQVIKLVKFDKNQFLSPIFLRLKKNNEYRLILNLKDLNQFIPYRHFKMDTFENALTLIRQDMFMASIDIRHAYYSIMIAEEDQLYLRFVWADNIYQFRACPNGIAHGPIWFTKIMKPVYATLRNMGHVSTGFIDDSLLCGQSKEQCLHNITDSVALMTRLGFMINQEKSVMIPTQIITYLGNIIDSNQMIVYLPSDKKDVISVECTRLSKLRSTTIRDVAKVIGLMVSSFSAVEYGKLHYRHLEMGKIKALKMNKGDYDSQLCLTSAMKLDLQWWASNIHTQYRHINRGNPDLVIQTDSSTLGWGYSFNGKTGGGRWSQEEKQSHINVLELRAILFALKTLRDNIQNLHVKILSDSSTAVCYVANMGGCKSAQCDKVARDIWNFCINIGVWLSIAHIPGKTNEADGPSREFNDKLEWELSNDIFLKVCLLWGKPTVDLFASRLNHKLDMYCSFKSDPNAAYVDAFSFDWRQFQLCYVFPPFSLLSRCIGKIQRDQAQAIIIVPLWPTQTWFPGLLNILVDQPRILPKTKTAITMPHTGQEHPLWRKLVMIACLVSGIPSEIEDFHQKLPAYLLHHGESQLETNTSHIYQNGYISVNRGKSVKFLHL